MLTMTHVETTAQQGQMRELLWEYVLWGGPQMEQDFGIRLDLQVLVDQEMADLQKYASPRGRLLLAFMNQQLAGCGGLRAIGSEIGEIKRMFVRPQYRGQGIGRALVTTLISEARQIGYTTLRLDSGPFMRDAHVLYRSIGFRPIPAYPECDIPAAWQPQWHFMELSLQP